MNPADKTIFIVEDDAHVRDLVAAYLRNEGYQIVTAGDGHEALRQLGNRDFDMAILDLMLPGVDGLEIAKQVSVRHSGCYILMLTARAEDTDVLVGFGLGADDYVTKPFNPKILVARVNAALRKQGEGSDSETKALVRGEIVVDFARRKVTRSQVDVPLTGSEFDLLAKLAEHPGWVYSRAQLLEEIWGTDAPLESRTVDVHIANLRKKIESDPEHPEILQTVRGVGYKFEEPS